MTRFKDRVDGGKQLAEKLLKYKKHPDAIVLGLPRGGVITAFEVAKVLELPLDIVVPRKVGAPFNPELAVGAITQEGEVVWNDSLMKSLHLKPEDLADIIAAEKKESARRLQTYRGDRPPLDLKDKIVILVDDGIATGATMRASITSARARGCAKIVVAAPLAPIEPLTKIEQEADEFACVLMPKILMGISAFYDEFGQTSDEEVITIMKQTSATKPTRA